MIFNYDRDSNKLGSNKDNLKGALASVKDFFTKKQDIVKNYNPTQKENEYFSRLQDLTKHGEDLTSEKSIELAHTWAEELDSGNGKLIEYNSNVELGAQKITDYAHSQQQVTQGVTKFRAALTSVGSVIKSVGASMLNMGIAMAASWAIGKVIEGIDYLIHYDENIIKAGQEAKDSIDSTFKSFEEGKQSIMDLGSSFGDQTEQIKNTGDAIDQVAEKYVELRKGVNQNTNENVSLSTDEYQQYIDLSSKLASQFPGLVAGYDSQGTI